MPTKVLNSSVNAQLSLDKLLMYQRRYYNLPNSVFKANFLWKVSLKILNSGIIKKTFNHTFIISFLESTIAKRLHAKFQNSIKSILLKPGPTELCSLICLYTYRAVEISCPTCPTWSHFIQDKSKISIYLSLDKYNV